MDKNKQKNIQIFISYRRDSGDVLAKKIYDDLGKNYRIFMDIHGMSAGPFNQQIYDAIAESDDFILVLSTNSLDKCIKEDDWIRQEVETAINLHKNIIPLIDKNFTWPTILPKSMEKLPDYQGIMVNIEYYEAMLERLKGYLKSLPDQETERKKNSAISNRGEAPVLIAELRNIEENLLSRDAELEQIANKFENNKHVFLYGFGGLGKTTTALMYAHSTYARKRFSKIYFVRFNESMRKTILGLKFGNYFEQAMKGFSEDDIYEQKIRFLSQFGSDVLLIVDNFDSEEQSFEVLKNSDEYRDLVGCSLSVLFTTRSNLKKEGIPVREFSEQQLIELFYQFCEDDSLASVKEIKELILLLNGHTLMIELISRMINKSWGCLDLRTVLDNIQNHRWDSEDYTKVGVSRGYVYEERKLLEHLYGLFQLSGLSDDEKKVLKYIAAIPQEGINSMLFGRCLKGTEREKLDLLIRKGWIQNIVTEKTIMIHMLIRELCIMIDELCPNYSECKDFLNRMWNEYLKISEIGNLNILSQITAVYDYFVEYESEMEIEEKKNFYNRIVRLYHDMGHYQKECTIRQKKRKLYDSNNIKEQVRELLLIAQLKDENALFDESIELINEALKYVEQIEEIEEREYLEACCYNYRGFVIADIDGSGSKDAYKDKLNARKLFDKLGANDIESILNYHYLAYSEVYHPGGHNTALEHAKKAVNLLNNWDETRSILLLKAEILNSIGFIYEKMNLQEEAICYKQEALNIREKYLPYYHPDMARSFSNMANSLYVMKDSKALNYADKALGIRKQILGIDHPDYIATLKAKEEYLKSIEVE